MKLIVQPSGSSLCGHCCVAMAAGMSLRKVIAIVGHEKGMRTAELVRVLRAAGVDVLRDRAVRFTKPSLVPLRCVMRVQLHRPDDSFWTHWILRWDGWDYDPGGRRAYWLNRNPRLTSYLEIN